MYHVKMWETAWVVGCWNSNEGEQYVESWIFSRISWTKDIQKKIARIASAKWRGPAHDAIMMRYTAMHLGSWFFKCRFNFNWTEDFGERRSLVQLPFTGTFITLDPATRLTLPTPWNIHSQWSLLLPYRHPPLRYRPALLADPWPKFRRRPCWRWNTKWPSWVVVHPVPVRQKSLPKKRISTLYFLKERWITQSHVEVRSHSAWLGNSIYQNRLWIERYACRHEEYSFRIHYRGCTDVSFLWWC